ncbi:MAG: alpha-amylase, partial [Blastocatellia bacterium]|nr:alpha-amylase [Blastocatellia bacterium]
DKRLYDRLREGNARAVREHFMAGLDYQKRSVRFLENHDEPRAAAIFSPGQYEAAALITYLSPGMRFFHQGQFEGRKKRISPHLVRGPVEPINQELERFYSRLLDLLHQPAIRDGHWQLLDCVPAWEGNWTWDCFLAFAWQNDRGDRLLLTVNYAPNQSQCYVRLPFADLENRQWRFEEVLSREDGFDREGNDLSTRGLYIDAPPWKASVLSLKVGEVGARVQRGAV